MPLLELQDVRFAYGDREVVGGVSLALAAGEVVAVVGPNGAGKSTLLRLASGLLAPTGGTVRVEGTDLASLNRRAAAQQICGVAPEQRVELPFSVRESVAFGRHPWRSAFAPLSDDERQSVDAALDATDIVHLADRPLTALSSGERQRAAIARCLVQDAPIWLLDEPTAHLDLGHRLTVLELARTAARQRQRGVLMVLHDLNLAALAADRVALLVCGQLQALGTPSEVLTEAALAQAFGAHVRVGKHPTLDVPTIAAIGPTEAGS
ncbi:MAG: ABC transporter ATP-binding protein [Planctomycetota bacterium]|nr:ABC transporter ATP-binding protein [Planctomycetota bacterium]